MAQKRRGHTSSYSTCSSPCIRKTNPSYLFVEKTCGSPFLGLSEQYLGSLSALFENEAKNDAVTVQNSTVVNALNRTMLSASLSALDPVIHDLRDVQLLSLICSNR